MSFNEFDKRGISLCVADSSGDEVNLRVARILGQSGLEVSASVPPPVFFHHEEASRERIRALGVALIRWADTGGL